MIQQSHGIKCHLVTHCHRYSHLRKFIYLAKGMNEKFEGLKAINRRGNIEHLSDLKGIHPYAALSTARKAFPQDLSLSTSECWNLFRVMSSVAQSSNNDDIMEDINKLRPENFFEGISYLRNADVVKYETALRKTIEKWIASPCTREFCAQVIAALSEPIEKGVASMEADHGEDSPYTLRGYQRSLLTLLSQLHSVDALPAIIFQYDRYGIERLARDLLHSLKSAEDVWKSNNKAWQDKVAEWANWQSLVNARRRREDARPKLSTSRAVEELRDAEPSPLETFDPYKPLPQFSFLLPQAKVSGQELESQIEELLERNNIPDWITDCLRRGIGIHHSGLNRRLRQLVESLFRAGTLRIVIATG